MVIVHNKGMLSTKLNHVFFPASVEKKIEEINQIQATTNKIAFHWALKNIDMLLSACVIQGSSTVLKLSAISKIFGNTNQKSVTTAMIAMMIRIEGYKSAPTYLFWISFIKTYSSERDLSMVDKFHEPSPDLITL